MPRIIVQANDDDRPEVIFSERIVAANLESDHYASQLLERLSWATSDAEALERSGSQRRAMTSAWSTAKNPSGSRDHRRHAPAIDPSSAALLSP
jgi:hypothetical protein